MNNSNLHIIHRRYRYRILPSKRQHAALASICESQRVLYNAALEERIDYYKKIGKSRSFVDQSKALTELRKIPGFSDVPANLQRWTLKRLDHAYRCCFARIVKGKKPGFPRFKGTSRWSSFGFNEFSGVRLQNCAITFKGMPGKLRVHFHRRLPLDAHITGCTFCRDHKGWYVSFSITLSKAIGDNSRPSVGIDLGLSNLATLSTGETIPNVRVGRRHAQEMRRRQRALARCRRGSNKRKQAKLRVRRLHARISQTRQTYLHQQSALITKRFAVIAVENLTIVNLLQSNLAKSINDASWSTFLDMLDYKAADAGGKLIRVNPRYTSQTCSGCSLRVPKKLSERVHSCSHCGLNLDRDHNAAINILSLADVGGGRPKMTECGESADVTVSRLKIGDSHPRRP